jgi:hypothetical protein
MRGARAESERRPAVNRRDPIMTFGQLLDALGVDKVWTPADEPAETAVEPQTDAVWYWVVAGIRWRSCGCRHAGRTHREES